MKAQTTLDFMIAMSVFLVTVTFVLSFSTGLTGSFVDTDQAHTVIANRVADTLSEGMLGDHENPFVLDDECTTAFFGGTPPGDCNFDPSNSLKERVGLEGRPAGTEPELNVVIQGDLGGGGTEVLCWDNSGGTVVKEGNAACDVRYQSGATPPTDIGSVVVARRMTSINGNDATVLVRVWS